MLFQFSGIYFALHLVHSATAFSADSDFLFIAASGWSATRGLSDGGTLGWEWIDVGGMEGSASSGRVDDDGTAEHCRRAALHIVILRYPDDSSPLC